MRALFFSLLVLIAPLAHANSDNGVERGDVSVNGNDSIPKGLEDQLESLIFSRCNLRGAVSITTSYLKVSGEDLVNSNANDYQIQYSVAFKDGGAPALILVHALLTVGGSDGGIRLLGLSSPICKALP